MRINHSPTDLLGDVDNLSLDKIKFDPTSDDIERICRFFSIGKLRHFEKEKGISFYHANPFVYVETTHGKYALKFYPTYKAQIISIEYASNRILTDHHFPTPTMYAGVGGQPFFTSNDRLAACYSYINGQHVWQHIEESDTIHQINTAILSLKNILSSNMKLKNLLCRMPSLNNKSLAATINSLRHDSRPIAPYNYKKIIDASLLDASQTYQHHQRLFTHQWLYHDTIISNFLICKGTVYTIDLDNIQEAYVLYDLATLVISCLFYDISTHTIKTIVKDYFIRHKIKQDHFPVLDTLVKIRMIKEYLQSIKFEKNVKLSAYPPDLRGTYLTNFLVYKEKAAIILKNINDISRAIV